MYSSITVTSASVWLGASLMLSYPEDEAIGPGGLFISHSETLAGDQRYELPVSDGGGPSLTETEDNTARHL